MREFKSFYKTVEGNEGNVCHYPTRLDTYGCGCAHDCNYCYARSLLDFRGLWNPQDPAVADIHEIAKVLKTVKPGTILRLGGMTDCFQPCELKYRRTLETIEMMNRRRIGYLIVTKSHHVADDEYLAVMDKDLAHIQVTVTTLDDALCATYEKASPPSKRIQAIKRLQDEGFDVAIRLSPIIDAVMSGCNLMGTAMPDEAFLRERYIYSLFALDLDNCPDVFHGDFEDDIEYRLKCRQMGKPTVQVVPLRYGKTGQKSNKDLTGCRAEYAKQGLKRGAHMSVLYSQDYSARMSKKAHSTNAKEDAEAVNFKHDLKTWKVGVIMYNMQPIKDQLRMMLKKYNASKPDQIITRSKKIKVKKH